MATHGKSHGETSLWTTVCGVRKEMDKTMMKQQQQQSSLCTLAKVIFHYINITMPSPSLNFYLSPQFKVQIFTFLTGLFLVANDYFSSIISPLPTSFIQVLKVIKIHSNSQDPQKSLIEIHTLIYAPSLSTSTITITTFTISPLNISHQILSITRTIACIQYLQNTYQ